MDSKLSTVLFDESYIDLLYQWVNEVECRKNSFNTNAIPYDQHVNWCYEKLRSNDTSIYIVLFDKKIPIGQIRLVKRKAEIIISYSVDKKYRGKGYGTKFIELIVDNNNLIDAKDSITLVAEVKKDNIASQKIFEKCGFCRNELGERYVYKKLIQ